MTLDYAEKRLEKERALITQQMTNLEEEMAKQIVEFQTTRSEASSRVLLTDAKLSRCVEELQIAHEEIVQIKEANHFVRILYFRQDLD